MPYLPFFSPIAPAKDAMWGHGKSASIKQRMTESRLWGNRDPPEVAGSLRTPDRRKGIHPPAAKIFEREKKEGHTPSVEEPAPTTCSNNGAVSAMASPFPFSPSLAPYTGDRIPAVIVLGSIALAYRFPVVAACMLSPYLSRHGSREI